MGALLTNDKVAVVLLGVPGDPGVLRDACPVGVALMDASFLIACVGLAVLFFLTLGWDLPGQFDEDDQRRKTDHLLDRAKEFM